jgi:hypothetical protein
MQIQHYYCNYQLSVTIHEQHTKTKNTPLLTYSPGFKWISELLPVPVESPVPVTVTVVSLQREEQLINLFRP